MRLQFDPFHGDDEDAAAKARQVLVEGFGRWLEARPALGAEPVDADLLLNWKYGYGDGDFGTWTRFDVDEVLLEHLPRKLSATPAEAASIPVSLGAFVHYLDEEGLLGAGSDDPGAIADWALDQRQAFLDAMEEPANWGMAKRFFAGSGLDDLGDVDQAAVDAAMERFNALPVEERTRILGSGGMSGDLDDGPTITLPLRMLPSLDEVDAASRDVPLLAQVDALHRALGDRTGDVGAPADLPALDAVAQVALEAGAALVDGDRLVAAPGWLDMTAADRWELVVEAVFDCGASSLSFGAADPPDGQLVGEADAGAPHFVAMLWLAGEPLPLDAFADRLEAVERMDRRTTGGRGVARPLRRQQCRARVAEVVDSLTAAGIVARIGDEVELTAAGARVVAPLLDAAGYDVWLPEEVAELDAAEVLDLLVEAGGDPAPAAAYWAATPADRRRRAGELVDELVEETDPERILLGVGLLGAFEEDAVDALRGALDTTLAPQAWMLLTGAGAVAPEDVPLEMVIQAGIDAFVGMAHAGLAADAVQSILGTVPVAEHVEFIDRLASTDHPRTAELLEVIGRHHPEKPIGKHARKTAHRWRSRHAAPRR